MKYLNTLENRELDLIAQKRFSIPGIILMEHASLGLADVVLSHLPEERHKIAILCGKGNNGGDGFAAARHLHNSGKKPVILLLGSCKEIKAGSDAATNMEIAAKMQIPIIESIEPQTALKHLSEGNFEVCLDAVFGTGLSSQLRGSYPALFEEINKLHLHVIAVDVPSGLNSDTGMPMGAAIRAKQTVTFGFAKTGFQLGEADQYCGEIIVKGIGLPREVIESPETFLQS